ncbi:MAG: hypothetical protein AB1716_13750, partial [Planctomycetota bacterium]
MQSVRLVAGGLVAAVLLGQAALAAYTNNILVTGYWPPTNEMVRHFSQDPNSNPGGWRGENWEGMGYDVMSYFPEFPGGLGAGVGDFMVDYQDTSADFWRIVADVKPVAIVSLGRAEDNTDFRLEGGERKFPLNQWYSDYISPYKPTAELPIAGEQDWKRRFTSLPTQDILDEIAISGAHVRARRTTLDYSNFLCDFLGYHVNWYHDLHSEPNDPAWNVASGFIHVGGLVTVEDGRIATEATLRALIRYVDGVVPEPASLAVLLVAAAFTRVG